MNRIYKVSVIAALLLGITMSAAATAVVDPSFIPAASKPLAYQSSMGLVVQPDGKTVIWGPNFVVSGKAKGTLARLNTDGSVDDTFSYCACLLFSITNVAAEPDGKLLVAGTDNSFLPKVIRLNTDGSTDTSFAASFSGFQSGATATIYRIQSDGKILVTANGDVGSGYHQGYLTRLNTDGSADNTFTNIAYDGGRLITVTLRAVAVDIDGKIYIATTNYSGGGSHSYLQKYTSTGAVDSSWQQPSISNISGSGADIYSLDVDSSNRLVIGGIFDRVNGFDSKYLARLMPAGNLDLTFTRPDLPSSVSQVTNIANSKVLINCGGHLYRLNTDGSFDNTFVFPATINLAYYAFAVSSSGPISFFGQSSLSEIRPYRLNLDGDIDTSFQPNVAMFSQTTAVALQSDGKVLFAGNFTQVNGIAKVSIARLNTDGTIDPSFDPGTGFDLAPTSLVVQTDGKILAVGSFTTYNGVAMPRLIRINSDGSLDAAFAPSVSQLAGVSLQSDGKILLFGAFSTVNGVAKTAVARLFQDGTLDSSFSVLFSASANVMAFIQQADGKFMVGGAFTGVDGFSRPNLVRLNSDGSLDQTFTASGVGTVRKILVQPDGKYLVLTISGIIRRNSDGSADAGFATHTFGADGGNAVQLNAMLLQADGSIIVGGSFTTVDSTRRNDLIRLSSSGKLDLLFLPAGADQQVNALVAQSDGNVLLGGDFTRVNTAIRTGIARITPGALTHPTHFDFDGDGKADFTVLRPSTTYWYSFRSSDSQVAVAQFYAAGDIAAPADYDGDGKTDFGVFRPSNGNWYYLSSANGGTYSVHWGQNGDIPFPGDADGDGRADFRIYRPSTSVWYTHLQNGLEPSAQFGISTDIPIVGDFDGDGKVDPAIFRPSTGDWWFLSSIDNSQRAFHWGQAGDIPATADFDGDGKSDCAVFRPSDRTWYILYSHDLSYSALQFGLSTDKPVPADYDGDGKADIAVFRPSSGTWYVMGSASGFFGLQFGANGDIPAENAFVPQ
ncbi:MAG: FG-GAP-like repeat-containing protein [Acidobacteriota bacterium]